MVLYQKWKCQLKDSLNLFLDIRRATNHHDEGRKELPAEEPELVGLVAGHLLDAVAELLRAEPPPDGHGLPEAHPQQRHARTTEGKGSI